MSAEMLDSEEILDLVDENNEVVGTITHEESFDHRNLGGYNLRAVNALLINSAGEIWTPRRRPEKRIMPGGLDFSVGEHVRSGEQYDDAIIRGFREELSMDLNIGQLTMHSVTTPASSGIHYFCHNYFYESDDWPDYNRKDFSGAEWVAPNQLIGRLKNGDWGKNTIIEVVEQYLNYQAEHSGDK